MTKQIIIDATITITETSIPSYSTPVCDKESERGNGQSPMSPSGFEDKVSATPPPFSLWPFSINISSTTLADEPSSDIILSLVLTMC